MRPQREIRSPWRGRRLSLVVAAVGAVTIGMFWAGLLYHLDQRRVSILDTTRSDIARLSIALKQQVERLIAGVDDDLRSARESFAQAPAAFDFASWMDREDSLRETALQIVMADETGAIRGAKVSGTAGALPANIAGEDYFKAQAARDDRGLYVDRTAAEPVTGRYAIRLSRRLSRPDGGFGGVVAVFLDAEYLTGQFRMLSMGEDGCIALFGRDGYLRARSPAADTVYEDVLTATPTGRALFERLRADEGGSLELPCLSDAGPCLFAYRSLARLPLFMVVGRGVTEVLQPYEAERSAILIVGTSLSVLILVLFAGLLGALERRRRREIELARSIAAFRMPTALSASGRPSSGGSSRARPIASACSPPTAVCASAAARPPARPMGIRRARSAGLSSSCGPRTCGRRSPTRSGARSRARRSMSRPNAARTAAPTSRA